jgi:hypothetical protein
MSVTPSIEEQKHPASETDASADMDERARKRLQVGLSARRPTAKVALTRPPDVQTLPAPAWLLAALLVGVMALTLALLALNMSETRPRWWPVADASSGAVTAAATQSAATQGGATVVYALRLGEDFSRPTAVLPQDERGDEWRTSLVMEESVLRMEVWPHRLAWSLLGIDDLGGYRLQTSTAVDAQSADGFAGVILRFQDERHFYLFSVDDQGRYAVQQQDGDELRVVVPWTAAAFLNPAGSSNVLTVEDDGTLVRFLGNGMLLYDLTDPAFGLGSVGLAGGAQGEERATLEFDWFQLYDIRATTP